MMRVRHHLLMIIKFRASNLVNLFDKLCCAYYEKAENFRQGLKVYAQIIGLTFGSTYFSFGMSGIATQGQTILRRIRLIANSVIYQNLS